MIRLWQRAYRDRWAYFFVLPSVAAFAILVAFPLLQAFQLSFFDATLLQRTWVGLGNYVRLFSDTVFVISLRNTLLLVAGVVPVTAVLALIIAVLAFGLPRFGQAFVRMAFYLPTVASGVVLSLIWLWILNPVIGLANWLLSLIGVPAQTWLANAQLAFVCVAVVLLNFTLGQPIIIFMAALGAIPEELYDAAKIDGAGPFREFWHITLPMLRPTTLFILVTRTIAVFQVFAVVMLLTKGGPAYATETIVYRIYEQAFEFGQYGYASTQGIILLVIIMLVTLLQFRITGAASEL